MLRKGSTHRQFSKHAALKQQAQRTSPPQNPHYHNLVNDANNPELNIDALAEQLYSSQPSYKPGRSNFSLFTKVIIATVSSIGLSLSIYVLLPSLPGLLSANFGPDKSPLLATPEQTKIETPSAQRANGNVKNSSPTSSKLQDIALNIVQSSEWDEKSVNRFNLRWHRLDQQQQNHTRDTIWYQMFERALIQQLNYEFGRSNRTTRSARDNPLVSLAISLNLLDTPAIDEPKPVVKRTQRANKRPPVSTVKKPNSTTTINRRKVKPTPPPVVIAKRTDNLQSKTSPKPTALPKAVNTNADKVISIAKINSPTRKRQILKRPTYAELNDITVQFIDAYESGNLQKFTSLFALNAFSNKHDNLIGIRKEYAELFATTSERQMFIQNLQWTYLKNKAVGKGTIELVTLSENNSEVITNKGKIQIVTKKENNKVLITRFYHLTN